MNTWYTHYLNETRRRQDETKKAEAYRMAKHDPLAPSPGLKAHQRLFTALGVKMVQWGYSLQARYEDLTMQPMTPQSNHQT